MIITTEQMIQDMIDVARRNLETMTDEELKSIADLSVAGVGFGDACVEVMSVAAMDLLEERARAASGGQVSDRELLK